MKNNKIYSVISIIFAILTISLAVLYFANYVSIDMVMLVLGFTQLFSGLNQIKMSQLIDSKGNKTLGIFSIILGSLIIIAYIIKVYFNI